MEDRAAGEITEEGHENGNGGGRGNPSPSTGGADREGRARERGAPRLSSQPHTHALGSTWSNLAAQMQLPRLDAAAFAKVDDFYSPIKPEHYIALRLKPAIAFYQMRVPTKTHLRLACKLSLLIATVASSFLARFQYNHLVTVVTAFSSLIISYSEFADADRKVER